MKAFMKDFKSALGMILAALTVVTVILLSFVLFADFSTPEKQDRVVTEVTIIDAEYYSNRAVFSNSTRYNDRESITAVASKSDNLFDSGNSISTTTDEEQDGEAGEEESGELLEKKSDNVFDIAVEKAFGFEITATAEREQDRLIRLGNQATATGTADVKYGEADYDGVQLNEGSSDIAASVEYPVLDTAREISLLAEDVVIRYATSYDYVIDSTPQQLLSTDTSYEAKEEVEASIETYSVVSTKPLSQPAKEAKPLNGEAICDYDFFEKKDNE